MKSVAHDKVEIATVAKLLRRIFIANYRDAYRCAFGSESTWGSHKMTTWDGGEDANGVHHQNTWMKAAAVCLAREFTPVDYVRAQFFYAAKRKPPRPNILLGEGAAANCQRFLAEVIESLGDKLQAMQDVYDVQVAFNRYGMDMPTAEAQRSAIADITISLSSIFRYGIMTRLKMVNERKHYRDGALRQYAFQPTAYMRVWGDLIPPDLRQDAVDFFQNYDA